MNATTPLWLTLFMAAVALLSTGVLFGSAQTQRRSLHFQALTSLLRDWRRPEMLAALQRLWEFYHEHRDRLADAFNENYLSDRAHIRSRPNHE